MNNTKNKLLLIGIYLIMGLFPLQAQIVKKGIEQLPKALGKNPVITNTAWKNFNGTFPSISAAASLNTTQPSVSFDTYIARHLPGASVAYERIINNTTVTKALRRTAERRNLPPSKGWPAKSEKALIVSSLDGLTLDGYRDVVPELPIPTNKIYLYRGMGLNYAALRNILQNGLRVQDTGKNSNDVGTSFFLVQMGTAPVSSDLMKKVDIRQTYLSTNAQSTLHFAAMHSFEDGRIPVVVTVRGWRRGNSYHVIREDIPVSSIVEVSALVQGPEGNPIWCHVSLTEDGRLALRPYLSNLGL